jgi:FKBP-type peptidyl-prolyl cis-trans isomerase FklB
MKNLLLVLSFLFAFPVFAQKTKPSRNSNESESFFRIKTKVDSISYAIGMTFAKDFKEKQIETNPYAIFQAMKAISEGNVTAMSENDAMNTLQRFQMEMQEKMRGEMKKEAEKNLLKGKVWLASNKTKKGVVELPSGLQYEIIKDGTGEKPKITSQVTTHYVGTLLDGSEFDSSIKRGEPATFPVSGVIKGWTEALQLMPVGSKWRLFIPADLAYGDAGSPPAIGPGETLIFEVELLSVQN